MKKIIKSNNGMIFVMAIFIVTFTILVISSLATLAYYNFVLTNATNNRSNAYYYADQGMERTLKNLETILESAKIYANERMRANNPITVSGITYDSYYDYLIKGVDITNFETEFKKQFEAYYIEYINTFDASGIDVANVDGIKITDDNISGTTLVDGDLDSGKNSLKGNIYFKTLEEAKTYYGAVFGKNKYTINNKWGYIDPANATKVDADKNYALDITVTGWKIKNNKAVFVRKVNAVVDINPWGFTNSASSGVDLETDTIYSSPQWANAIASSGDVIVNGGDVTINGDIYVNGKVPADTTADGTEHGGIIVGKGEVGDLTVCGNVYTNNYLHTMYPGSDIRVQERTAPLGGPMLADNGVTPLDYAGAVKQIYDRKEPLSNSLYSEKASNLNCSGSNDPLGLGDPNRSSLGIKQTDKKFIDYLKDTFKIQKKYGGFVYANNIQIEPCDFGISGQSSTINIAGSASVFDNVEVDGKGQVVIGNNFYGFRDESREYYNPATQYFKYNQSSSLVVNNVESTIDIGQRIYNAGIAYVTSFGTPNGTLEPYKTGETASLFKNYYAYRTPLDTVTQQLSGDPFEIQSFNPFKFVYFRIGVNPAESLQYKIAHIFEYNRINDSGLTMSEGGKAYDKSGIKLDSTIYNETLLNPAVPAVPMDMGFTRGILMGNNGVAGGFMALINPDVDVPIYGTSKNSTGSLSRNAFNWYVRDKYATLSEIKALKSINNKYVTINELIDNSALGTIKTKANKSTEYLASPSGYDGNIIIVDGDVTITTLPANKIRIDYGTKTYTTNDLTYKGIIFATGKISINTNKDITIDGAIISAKDLSTSPADTTGVEFSGLGKKTINYNKTILFDIFRIPESEAPDAKLVRQLLTSKRGTVEMFRKIYNSGDEIQGFKDAIDGLTIPDGFTLPDEFIGTEDEEKFEKQLQVAANLYEIYDPNEELSDKNVLSSGILNTLATESKNYKILKWKTIQ